MKIEKDVLVNDEEEIEKVKKPRSNVLNESYEEIKTFKKDNRITDKTTLHIAFQEILRHKLKQYDWK